MDSARSPDLSPREDRVWDVLGRAMRANHPPPFGLNQVSRTVAAGVASDPQGDSEEVSHVREAAMLALHPRQRRSHVLLTLFRCNDRFSDFVKQGGCPFNRKIQLYETFVFREILLNRSTNK